MKNQLKIVISSVCISFILFACSQSGSISPSGSRDIKYEITGNYTGTINLIAATNNDDFELIEIKKLPWKLEFIAKQSIKAVNAQGSSGSLGGVAGQMATLKTYVGGKEVSTGTGTATSSGYITMTNKYYELK